MSRYGYVKVGAAVPPLRVADTKYNADEIVKMIRKAEERGIQVLVFPELSITGYTCGDLFHQSLLLEKAEEGLSHILQETAEVDMLFAVGLPVQKGNQKWNTLALCHKGKVLGVVPKVHLPNYSEFYEKRWFSSGENLPYDTLTLCGMEVPFGSELLFRNSKDERLTIGVEICEDLWSVVPPSSLHALAGATLLLNGSASNELVAKQDYRRALVEQQSARCMAGYVYISSGMGESTTDLVFGGSGFIAENGTILAEAERYSLEGELIETEIDLEYLQNIRTRNAGYMEGFGLKNLPQYRIIPFALEEEEEVRLTRPVDPFPFVPKEEGRRRERAREIIMIQSSGLMKRLIHTGLRRVVLGISGGLDSTLALLVSVWAFDRLQWSRDGIIAVTMPGFGTTDRTFRNATQLISALGVTGRNISIREASLLHFRDIGFDPSVHDTTYENVQARERTQILMDIANKEGGLVVGTGDLSELALGWATYNGDHMSMYGVNAGVPKTLVRYLIEWAAEEMARREAGEGRRIAAILRDIIATPISPELLPPTEEGRISQKTEEIIGDYDLNDFFLYHMIKGGFSPGKILLLAERAFAGRYGRKTILKQMKLFYRRFFTQQFKRSCLPDGVKVGSISLSPRGDWRMPSDAEGRLWIEEVDALEKM